MDEETQKIIKDRFQELPEVIQKIITESNWIDTIRTISQKHNLRIDQGAVLENEVFLVMLGFQTPEGFLNNIVKEGQIQIEVASDITDQIQRDIFSKIKQEIINQTENNKTQTETDAEPTLNRDNLLKEIEDVDSNEIPQEKSNSKSFEEGIVQKAEQIKIDPYREPTK
jgi:hypothetical protein